MYTTRGCIQLINMEAEPQPEMSDEEAMQRLTTALSGSGLSPHERDNLFTFLNKIIETPDTTKVANLRDDKDLNEVGVPKLPVRTYQSLALVASDIMNNPFFEQYFKKEAEIMTSTSLSRNGFLAKLGVIQRREISDGTPRKKIKRGWFKPKLENPESQYGEPEYA